MASRDSAARPRYIVLGLMVVPIVASISDDAMRSVPHALREGAYALGGRRMRVTTRVVVPGALSGIVASFVLGISRAIGETMVVLIAAGNGRRSSGSLPPLGSSSCSRCCC